MNTILDENLKTQRNVASFLLRFTQDLWQDENGEPRVQWRGFIDHVQGKQSMPFVDFTEAMQFIQQQLQDLTLQAVPTADPQFQDKLLKESFKIWETFTRSYTDWILQTVGQTMERSQEMQDQMGETISKAFRMWMPPGFSTAKTPETAPKNPSEPDFNAIVNGLAKQVAELNEKITALEAQQEKTR